MERIYKKRIKIALLLLMVPAVLFFAYNYAVGILYPIKYKETIIKYSNQYGLDPFLVLAVIKAESGFKPAAVSPKNARGLMQISEKTGKWGADQLKIEGYTVDFLFDPDVNIQIGCWYLNKLFREFGDLELVLAAYNAGSGNVNQWLKNSKYSRDGINLDSIPFKETERYVKKVAKNYYIYKCLYEKEF